MHPVLVSSPVQHRMKTVSRGQICGAGLGLRLPDTILVHAHVIGLSPTSLHPSSLFHNHPPRRGCWLLGLAIGRQYGCRDRSRCCCSLSEATNEKWDGMFK
ncbi:hypothetical protein VTO42DRAFT_6159 [Malbranchea cinnamomea]